MSTPTTATATLPHYRPHHYTYPTSGTQSSYRSNGLPHPHSTTNPILPPATANSAATRLPPPTFSSTSAQYSPSSTANNDSQSVISNASTNGNGVPIPTATTSRPSYTMANIRPETDYSAAPTPSSHQPPQRDRPKRRRSREPDWSTFYKNGLPKEIIVIDDDSPEPQTVSSTQRPVNGGASDTYTNGTGSSRHVVKKRKRDDEALNVEGGYYAQKYATSHTSTPHMNGSLSASISTDRTTVRTAAATSLSSSSQYDYEVQLGQKRKRTRQQVANEAKRREVEVLGDAFISYKPPPYPPKKAGEVPVRVVHDVSCFPHFAPHD